MTVTVNIRMKQRRKTAADWTSANEVLLEGEIGLETDTRKVKYGDGTTAWNSLAYAASTLDTTANLALGAAHTAAELLSLLSTSDADIRMETQANGDFSTLVFRRTRASVAAVQSADSTGSIQFWGYDGASYIRTAQIISTVAATPGTNDMPGNLTFWTCPDGSATLTQRVTIHPDGTLEALAGIKATLPTYADNAAAVTGGLAVDHLYKTATGEVRIRV